MSSRNRPATSAALLTALLVTVLLATLGCEQLDKDRKPYTPFKPASVSTMTPAAPQPSASTSAGSFAPAAFEEAPDRAQRWTIAERTLAAPNGQYFLGGLSGSFSGPSATDTVPPDVVVWTEPVEREAMSAAGELWLYPSTGKPRKISEVPGYVPASPDCELDVQLAQTGRQTLTLDVTARCSAKMPERTPTRGIEVLSPARDQPRLLALRVANPAPGETLEFKVDSRDRDGDGRDDVQLEVSLFAHTPSNAARTRFSWYDRAAGLARDPEPTSRSFRELAGLEVVRATGRNTGREVPERADNARRLFSAICAEAGGPRVSDREGNPLSCGELGSVFGLLTVAEARAALTRGEPLEALAAIERAPWFEAELPDKLKSEIRADVRKLVPEAPAAELTRLKSRPTDSGALPRFSPLWFEDSHSLLMLTRDGVRRVRHTTAGFSGEDASEGRDPWPTTVIAEDGRRWMGVAFSCDRSEVALLLAGAQGNPADSQITRLLAPRPSGCAKTGYAPDLPTTPLGFREGQLLAYLGASRLFDEGQKPTGKPPLGGARSANGKHLVVPTSFGLWVESRGTDAKLSAKSWQLPQGSNSRLDSLENCVISDSGGQVACVQRGTSRVNSAVWISLVSETPLPQPPKREDADPAPLSE